MEKLLRRVYSSKKLTASLKIISHASVMLSVISYALVLVHFYSSEPILLVKMIAMSAVPFVLVSIARRIINAPRPYEVYEFYIAKPKNKAGRSFPSRHVFSAFLIAGLACPVSVWLSVSLFAVGICMAAARVLLGMHFVRDVLTGALVGILSSVIGIIIIF